MWKNMQQDWNFILELPTWSKWVCNWFFWTIKTGTQNNVLMASKKETLVRIVFFVSEKKFKIWFIAVNELIIDVHLAWPQSASKLLQVCLCTSVGWNIDLVIDSTGSFWISITSKIEKQSNCDVVVVITWCRLFCACLARGFISVGVYFTLFVPTLRPNVSNTCFIKPKSHVEKSDLWIILDMNSQKSIIIICLFWINDIAMHSDSNINNIFLNPWPRIISPTKQITMTFSHVKRLGSKQAWGLGHHFQFSQWDTSSMHKYFDANCREFSSEKALMQIFGCEWDHSTDFHHQ